LATSSVGRGDRGSRNGAELRALLMRALYQKVLMRSL
jgi:hypothetical protein